MQCYQARVNSKQCASALYRDLDWAMMNVTVHKLEGFRCSGVQNGEGIGMHLASFTGFTYWIRVCLRIKPETCHQVT